MIELLMKTSSPVIFPQIIIFNKYIDTFPEPTVYLFSIFL